MQGKLENIISMNPINSALQNKKITEVTLKKGTSPMEEESREKLGYLSYQVQ